MRLPGCRRSSRTGGLSASREAPRPLPAQEQSAPRGGIGRAHRVGEIEPPQPRRRCGACAGRPFRATGLPPSEEERLGIARPGRRHATGEGLQARIQRNGGDTRETGSGEATQTAPGPDAAAAPRDQLVSGAGCCCPGHVSPSITAQSRSRAPPSAKELTSRMGRYSSRSDSPPVPSVAAQGKFMTQGVRTSIRNRSLPVFVRPGKTFLRLDVELITCVFLSLPGEQAGPGVIAWTSARFPRARRRFPVRTGHGILHLQELPYSSMKTRANIAAFVRTPFMEERLYAAIVDGDGDHLQQQAAPARAWVGGVAVAPGSALIMPVSYQEGDSGGIRPAPALKIPCAG